MSDDFNSDDVYVEDSVREYNGARFCVFLCAVGIIFLIGLILVSEHFGNHLRDGKISLGLICGVIGIIYIIYLMIQFILDINATYNYTYKNGHLEIAKVRKNGQRKLLFSAECDSLETMGSLNKGFMRTEEYKKTRANDYTELQLAGEGLDDKIRESYDAYFNVDGKYTMVHFNPSEEFVKAMKRRYPSKVIYNENQDNDK